MKFTLFRPRVRINKDGVKLVKPRARIGGKLGVNISSQGISVSYRGRGFSISKTGLTITLGRKK